MGLHSVPAQFNLYVATVKEVERRLSAPSVSLKNAFDTVVIQDIDLAAFWPDSYSNTKQSLGRCVPRIYSLSWPVSF